jgi:hypothetical protein
MAGLKPHSRHCAAPLTMVRPVNCSPNARARKPKYFLFCAPGFRVGSFGREHFAGQMVNIHGMQRN